MLGFEVMAPSTLGTFLRSFTWGHVRQLDKVLGETLRRVWTAGAGPGDGPLVLDVDSTLCGVSGMTKAGAAYGYTNKLGYHPLIAVRADTGEVVHVRLRGGASQRGAVHFVSEAIARVRRAGAGGEMTLRADSGFWSFAMFEALEEAQVGYSITTPQYAHVVAQISRIPEDAWVDIDYPPGGQAQVAETTLVVTNPKKRKQTRTVRLVVRRSRRVGVQDTLWDDWRHHAFVTNQPLPTADADRHHRQRPDSVGTDSPDRPGCVESDRDHRRHASCELAIRDLKTSAGLAHLPSGDFAANAAWLAIATLAHNLYRWIGLLAGTQPTGKLTVGTTIRRRLFGIPGRIVNHSGYQLLRLPARWPWAHHYQTTLANLRNLPQLC